ncbi:MAG: class F sortase [Tepidiformaceae bacterium]
MKLLRIFALGTFAAGLLFSLLGFACSSGDGDNNRPADDFVAITATPAPPTTAATATATNEPAATPTPRPFDGAVAAMRLPRFGVDSPIEAIGLLPNNQLDIPKNPHNTGWYNIYDKPGFTGNAVFSAHVDYFPNIKGPFYLLASMNAGDEVVVVMENGLEYKYRVIRKQRYSVTDIPMGELIWPTTKASNAEWITLITCGGAFRATSSSGAGEYLQRDVVIAERYQ